MALSSNQFSVFLLKRFLILFNNAELDKIVDSQKSDLKNSFHLLSQLSQETISLPWNTWKQECLKRESLKTDFVLEEYLSVMTW